VPTTRGAVDAGDADVGSVAVAGPMVHERLARRCDMIAGTIVDT
jgi:hypothetical protein